MQRIVAIGGGEIGRSGYPVETTDIDKRILELTGKTRPHVLLLPTASSDSSAYVDAFEKHFGETLGCNTDVLCLLSRNPQNAHEIEEKIFGSDAVYVGGGNTAKMLRVWKRYGIDKLLRTACDQGIVMSGLSAGGICWFRYASSDSRKFSNPQASLMRLSGLGWINATACPHFDVEEDRKPKLREMMKRTPGVAIALDNCSAIEIVVDSYRIVCSRPGANAYRMYWSAGVVHEEIIDQDAAYNPLDILLSK
jgi:dipeptidase E